MGPVRSFYREKGVYIVNDEGEVSLVTMSIKAGCGQEPLGQNGIAHLVEHICLAYRHDLPNLHDRSFAFKEAGFRFWGHTNYGKTILQFSFPSHIENIVKFYELFKSIVNASIVCEEVFEMSKAEILSE